METKEILVRESRNELQFNCLCFTAENFNANCKSLCMIDLHVVILTKLYIDYTLSQRLENKERL